MNALTVVAATEIDPRAYAGIETQDAHIVLRDKYTEDSTLSAHRQASELLEAALRVNENDLACTIKMLERIHASLRPVKPRRGA